MPDLFPVNIEWFQAYLLVFTRISTTIAFMPVLGGAGIPNTVKAGLSALAAGIIFPFVDKSPVSMDVDMAVMAVMVAGEALIGIATAFMVNLVLSMVQLAGSIIDFQVGFGIVNVVDPLSGAQVSVTTQLMNIITTLVFLSINAHHMILSGIAGSFGLIPLGGAHITEGLGHLIINAMGGIFVSAAQIAAPVTITLLIQQAAMGIVARTVPQINIFVVGFPFTISIGLLTIAFTLPAFSLYMERTFVKLGSTLETMITLMR
ncbi:MAG: flagellar biosynthetic protein FliR [Nitrospinae bacterium]|nr:flagellar biosynthetic protein FliR [Nitrospinota bacterium]